MAWTMLALFRRSYKSFDLKQVVIPYFGIYLSFSEFFEGMHGIKITCNPFEYRKGLFLLFCVTVFTTIGIKERIPEEATHKIVAKHGQSPGYKLAT